MPLIRPTTSQETQMEFGNVSSYLARSYANLSKIVVPLEAQI